jgi:hypothetical protein
MAVDRVRSADAPWRANRVVPPVFAEAPLLERLGLGVPPPVLEQRLPVLLGGETRCPSTAA